MLRPENMWLYDAMFRVGCVNEMEILIPLLRFVATEKNVHGSNSFC